MKVQLKVLCGVLLAGACAAPHRDYDPQQIEGALTLEELMDVNASVADPLFKLGKKLRDSEITDEHWALFNDMGQRLHLTSLQVKTKFSKGPGFDAYLDELNEQSVELIHASLATDKSRTLDLLVEIKNTCAACHDEYK
ncbi:MAG: hypothetical protein ACI8X5_001996 [Planctomycetota bacterium]|jgi:hypothetical protein